ncbi:hypothetical protein ASF57_21570 [Methylobacterium sp. Leaf117]|nr:hypothetical protein ASF57_21570 [Methylobacterium sp. Leaf117]
MMSRVRRHPRDRGASAGFTLVEALAAFAIVAVLSLVVQRGVVQSRAGLVAVEDRLAAERVARSLLAEPLHVTDINRGGRTGTLNGYHYTIRLGALELPLPEPERDAEDVCQLAVSACDPADLARHIRWMPMRQDIEVLTRRGTAVTVETIRLGQTASADAAGR